MLAVRLGRLIKTMLPIQPRLCPLPQLEASRWPCPDTCRRCLLVQPRLCRLPQLSVGRWRCPGACVRFLLDPRSKRWPVVYRRRRRCLLSPRSKRWYVVYRRPRRDLWRRDRRGQCRHRQLHWSSRRRLRRCRFHKLCPFYERLLCLLRSHWQRRLRLSRRAELWCRR